MVVLSIDVLPLLTEFRGSALTLCAHRSRVQGGIFSTLLHFSATVDEYSVIIMLLIELTAKTMEIRPKLYL